MATAPSSGNQLAIASNNTVYASANSGATFAATGLGQNNSPFIYIPFDGSSVADVMGNSAVTATATSGSITYVPGKVGTNAVNLNNSAAVGGTATQYVRGTWSGASNFTFSGLFNAQTINGTQQMIYSAYQAAFMLLINTSNQLVAYTPSGGAGSTIVIGTTSFTIATNTWYSFTIIYQAGRICSFYLNNSLIGTTTNVGGTGTLTSIQFSLGTYDTSLANAFNGYIDDFRLYNYAVTNPSGAALINPIVGPITPFVYLTFDGSTTTDLMGNSTVTATGSPGFVAGQIGSNALDLSTNTAGGAPGKYVIGTWTGASIFTVSLWFNLQALGAIQTIFSAYGTALYLFVNASNVLVWNFPSGGGTSSGSITGPTLSSSIWYNAVIIFQTGGTCSLYLNNSIISSFTNVSGVGSRTTTNFGLGTYDMSAYGQALKGYIDDFRIYNGVFLPSQLSPVLYSPSYAIGSPNIYLPFENGSVLDVMGYSAVSARGTMNFVPGVVGSAALNLVNPAGGTAVNFLRGSWAGSPNFTVSFWFNLQALGVTYQNMFTSYSSQWAIDISSDRLELWYGGSKIVSSTLSLNTWYYTVGTFVANGTGELYLNGTRLGTYSCGATAGTSSGLFGIGTNDVNTVNAGNIYIDDFKLYNSAVPFHTLGPMNYTQAAISNSGAYQVVAAANGGVYTSTNSGSSWSQAVTSPQVASAVNTVGGQIITPQLTGLAAYTWTQNGVSWTASASTTLGGGIYDAYRMFNTTYDSNSRWVASSSTYNTAGNSSGISNTIIGIAGTQTGDWLQIQSSVPLVMSSYQFATSPVVARLPKTYYITGSNDGSNWYPLQYGNGGAVTTTAIYTLVPGVILINSTSTQTFGSSTVATTAYSTSTNAYTYFRLVILASYNSSADYLDICEWLINFATPSTPLYVAPSTALLANQSLSAITVMPQQTGLASNTWTTNGISWTASASSAYTGQIYYSLFNNSYSSSDRWNNDTTNYTSSGYGGARSTTINILGSVTGDWVQIQSSIPLVLSTYMYASASYAITRNIQSFYMIGSTDGSTWYPIQYCTSMSANPYNAICIAPSSYISTSSSGTVSFTGNVAVTGSFNTYGFSSTPFTYFRLIVKSNFSSSADYCEISELFINFTAYTPALLQSLSVSPTGQYMALTGAGAVAPQLTGLTGNTSSSTPVTTTWVANGVTWTCNASSVISSSYQPWLAFNNVASNIGTYYSWASNTGLYRATSLYDYIGSTSTTVSISGTPTAILGEWLQIQSSIPLVMSSYTFSAGGPANFPQKYYIVGSNDGSTWYPIQYVNITTTPSTAGYQACSTYLTVSQSGIQPIQGGQTGSATTTSYNTAPYSTTSNAYTYFRMITTNVTGVGQLVEIIEWYINFQSGPTFYSTNYGSSWTTTLSAATVPNANLLATSGNGQYSLQGSGQIVTLVTNTFGGYSTGTYTTPTFSPALSTAVGPVNCASISATGQYMVILIQSTTNNVYYSTNYGVSFTGITLGSTTMMSCAISADGSYITVANATQVYTLNSNTQGYSITVGNQSGLINQGQNAVAIGNQAGTVNQSANSIVLNSSGAAVNAYAPGFFVAPVALAGSSVSSSFSILGYGTDSQVVQTGMSIRADGFVGIGTVTPGQTLDVNGITRSVGVINTGYTYATIYGTIPALALWTTTWATTTTLSGGVSASAPTATSYVYIPYGTYAGSSSTVNNWSITPTVSNYAGRWYIPYTGIWSLSWSVNIGGGGSATLFISVNSCNANDLNTGGQILMNIDMSVDGCINWTGLLLSTDYISFGAFLWAGTTCNFQSNPARTRVTLSLVQRTA
jgi:hypothetical protein